MAKPGPKRKGTYVICETCGGDFYVPKSRIERARFCSADCRDQSYAHERSHGLIVLECHYCHEEFRMRKTKYRTRCKREQEHFFCSDTCYRTWRTTLTGKRNSNWRGGPVTLNCDQCGTGFEMAPSAVEIQIERGQEHFFCSRECMGQYRSEHWQGENNPHWNGGIETADGRQELVHTREYQEWRKTVFERDNYTCQHCGKRGSILHAHHVKSWHQHERLRFAISNGITLCRACHFKTHNGYPLPEGNRWGIGN